ncbi:MAG TPA: MarR family transcriptional regulator [Chloroflexota bacterium]|nr:MarR family transcriptional regulator [Chloroflexota bacterium]
MRDRQRQELVHRVLSVQEAMREDAFAHIGTRLSGAEATTLAQTRVLFQLRAAGPLSVSELAERLGISPPAVSPVVDQLVRRRLLSRTEHSDDRRITMVDLTDGGRAFIEGALLVRNQRLVEALQRLSDDELETVAAAFDILSRMTNELRRDERASARASTT